MEIINSILFVMINAFLMQFLLKSEYRFLKFALMPTVVFVVLNLFFGALPIRIIPIALFYSVGILVLNIMSSRVNAFKKNTSISEEKRERLLKIKYYLMHFVVPIGVTVFQIILLFNKKVQAGILK